MYLQDLHRQAQAAAGSSPAGGSARSRRSRGQAQAAANAQKPGSATPLTPLAPPPTRSDDPFCFSRKKGRHKRHHITGESARPVR